MLPKHPIIATATVDAVAAAHHSPPPQPRSLRDFILVVVLIIVTAITTVFPSSPAEDQRAEACGRGPRFW